MTSLERPSREPSVESVSLKTVAVIVPCRNEENHISRCLDSLLSTDYDRLCLEIVVVDGMSTDGTRRILDDYRHRHGCVRVLDNPLFITPVALNIGIRETDSDLFIICGSHSVYPDNFIAALVKSLEKHGADCVGGTVSVDQGNTLVSRALAIAYTHPFAAGNSYWRSGSREVRQVRTAPYGCYRREVVQRIGLFNERLVRAQDREFNERLTAAGGRIILDPSVQTRIYARSSMGAYWRWNVAGSYWFFRAREFTRTKMISWRNLVPLIFVGWHLVVVLAAILGPSWMTIVVALPILLYWVLNVISSVLVAVKHRSFKLFPLMLLVFAATHYGYGLGSMAGVAQWLLRRR
jgi:succinoglycan biosynthesis protein ExoA